MNALAVLNDDGFRLGWTDFKRGRQRPTQHALYDTGWRLAAALPNHELPGRATWLTPDMRALISAAPGLFRES